MMVKDSTLVTSLSLQGNTTNHIFIISSKRFSLKFLIKIDFSLFYWEIKSLSFINNKNEIFFVHSWWD